jgi:RNA polymerase sigma-70 factor (ECF subfamily)
MTAVIEEIYRRDSRRVFSTLVRLLGSFDRPKRRCTTPSWPPPSSGRCKACRPTRWPGWCRRALQGHRPAASQPALRPLGRRPLAEALAVPDAASGWEQQWDARQADIEDDRLRLIFTCCHPSLSEEARIALTLREVCGLTTEAIAAAFLVATPTLAQRIVRAKAKIAAARIPYEVPGPAERVFRLASVLRVVYLVFNEGHSARRHGGAARRPRRRGDPPGAPADELLPEPEVMGLLG